MRGRCLLTTEVDEVGPEEGGLVELIDLAEVLSVQLLPQCLLASRLVRDERLKHCAHHVQLG